MEIKVLSLKQDLMTNVFTLKFIPRESKKAEKILTKIMNSQGKDLNLEFTPEKRSNRANAYMWELIGKAAEVLGVSQETLYKKHIKDYGQSYVATYSNYQAAKLAATAHKGLGIGWTTEVLDVYPDGSVDVVMYCGSSIYNREQMARLIEGVIDTCKSLEIETKDEGYINSLLEEIKC